MIISREQIKAARAMLDWSQKVLAQKCRDISEPTVKLIETGKVNSTETTLTIIKKTFESAGLEFLQQNGVRFREDIVTIIEKKNKNENIYLRLLDDVYYSLEQTGGEVLIGFADNEKSTENVVQRQLALRKAGIGMRFLIRNGDKFLRYPLQEYRCLPKGFFINSPTLVYGEKYAVVLLNEIDNTPEKILIIRNPLVADLQRRHFDYFWESGETPTETDAEVTYD